MVAEAARMRVMQGPPWSGVAERRRILTDDPEAVNSVRGAALALALVALALAGTVRAAAADPPRPPRGLRLLVVLAGFPDRPLAKSPAHFARQLSRFVAYWTEVSSGRLRLVPTLDELAVTLPGPRRSYVGRPDALARDALAAAATAPAAADALIVFLAGAGPESHAGPGPAADPGCNYLALVSPAAAAVIRCRARASSCGTSTSARSRSGVRRTTCSGSSSAWSRPTAAATSTAGTPPAATAATRPIRGPVRRPGAGGRAQCSSSWARAWWAPPSSARRGPARSCRRSAASPRPPWRSRPARSSGAPRCAVRAPPAWLLTTGARPASCSATSRRPGPSCASTCWSRRPPVIDSLAAGVRRSRRT